MKRLLLLGGGHSHVEVVRRFGVDPPHNARVTLVSPERYTPYSGMLPGLVAGHYGFHECHIDLASLASRASVALRLDTACAIDPDARVVRVATGDTIAYDVCSIDVGSTPPIDRVTGAAEHAIAVKPVSAYLGAWDRLLERARAGALQSLTVVGGGAAGAEMLLAMQYRLATECPAAHVRYRQVTDSARLLPMHPPGVRSALERILARNDVDVSTSTPIARVESGALISADGLRIASDAIVWITGAAPATWLKAGGLALARDGFISINNHLQSTSHATVFAAGDCASIEGATHPKSGVYAVRQGPPLAENLRRALRGEPLVSYKPQHRSLALISTGSRHAIASWGPLWWSGDRVWHWKDRIDRRFMARYAPTPGA